MKNDMKKLIYIINKYNLELTPEHRCFIEECKNAYLDKPFTFIPSSEGFDILYTKENFEPLKIGSVLLEFLAINFCRLLTAKLKNNSSYMEGVGCYLSIKDPVKIYDNPTISDTIPTGVKEISNFNYVRNERFYVREGQNVHYIYEILSNGVEKFFCSFNDINVANSYCNSLNSKLPKR